jgi:hypothetical protein
MREMIACIIGIPKDPNSYCLPRIFRASLGFIPFLSYNCYDGCAKCLCDQMLHLKKRFPTAEERGIAVTRILTEKAIVPTQTNLCHSLSLDDKTTPNTVTTNIVCGKAVFHLCLSDRVFIVKILKGGSNR